MDITLNAFGYEHELIDSYNEEEAEAIENAPLVYIIAGDDEMVETFSRMLLQDQHLFWSEAGEALLFAYEELEDQQYDDLLLMGLEYYLEDRSALELAAA